MAPGLRSENIRNFQETPVRLNYGNFENPQTFGKYQILLLLFDVILNWAMEISHTQPLAILVFFM